MTAATLPDYDAIPYESFPILDTSPDRMASIGGLFGLDAPDPTRARILEIGCASGGNLIPLAWHWPKSECLGVELGRAQAVAGIERVARLGIPNIEIRHQDLLDLPLDGPPFDYIMAHGVYSWVPEQVRDHILSICGARLSHTGIAYINFNSLPGGHLRQMLRGMLLHHVRDVDAPGARLRKAREMLNFLAVPLADKPLGTDWLQKELAYLRGARDSYLYHEYLEGTNEAFLFHDFVQQASGKGLQYLADVQLHTMFADTLGAAAVTALDALGDLLAEEQYGDFLRLRGHRQVLLCRADIELNREIDLGRIANLPVWTDLQPDRGEYFRNAAGQRFAVRDKTAKRALLALSSSFPGALSLSEWLRANQTQTAGVVRDETALEWLNLLISGALHGTRIRDPRQERSSAAAGFDPLISEVLTQGETRLPTPRHQTVQLDAKGLDHCRCLLAGLQAELQEAPGSKNGSRVLELLLQRHGILNPPDGGS
jgi:SAM-dependent methyltransferase